MWLWWYIHTCEKNHNSITAVEAGAYDAVRPPDRNNKQAIFKNCALFTDCINQINNTQVDNTKGHDLVLSMYNLLEYIIIIQKHPKVYTSFSRNEPKILAEDLQV